MTSQEGGSPLFPGSVEGGLSQQDELPQHVAAKKSTSKKFSDLSNEILEMILESLDEEELRVLLSTNRRFFDICSSLLHKKLSWKTYIALFKHSPLFTQGPRAHLYAESVRTVVLGGRDHYHSSTRWEWDEVIQTLSRFPSLQTLVIDHITVPLYRLPDVLGKLPRLKQLSYRSCTGGGLNFTPQSLENLETEGLGHFSHLEVRRLYIPNRHGFIDAGVMTMAALSTLPSLRTLHVDTTSWETLLRGRNEAGWSLPQSLQQIVVSPAGRPNSHAFGSNIFQTPRKTRGFLDALEPCVGSLESLKILVPEASPNLRRGAVRLNFLRLKEFVGPQELIPNIGFPPEVETVWVPGRDRLFGPPSLGSLPSPSTNLRFLSVGNWDVIEHPLRCLLVHFPNLEELSLTPRSAIAKHADKAVFIVIALSEPESGFYPLPVGSQVG
ncbi:hypothetical protein AAF712_009328 [Marasmius tenuissimus]|uniref:F-box domain-containing protein n=1 Tax=Marasmius tenuissimus TaxID=585030 RepID=A0ABR2ZQ15_9AGAR